MITVEQFVDVLKHIKNKEGFIYYHNGVFDYFIGSIIVLNGYVIFLKSMFKSESLNIRELVETREISKKIVGSIVKHINSREPENVVILGMDMVGALLAARIAFELKFPMSYFVSVKNERYNS